MFMYPCWEKKAVEQNMPISIQKNQYKYTVFIHKVFFFVSMGSTYIH